MNIIENMTGRIWESISSIPLLLGRSKYVHAVLSPFIQLALDDVQEAFHIYPANLFQCFTASRVKN